MTEEKIAKIVKMRRKTLREKYIQYYVTLPTELVKKWKAQRGKVPERLLINETDEGALIKPL